MEAEKASSKRRGKRLSKACDPCHKSKRRCDGTSPCSNCYFASKPCTYTDSNGRPVPAPRTTNNPGQPSSYASPNNPASSFTLSQEAHAPPRKRRRQDEPSQPLAFSMEPALTRELTNLFLTHDHPALSIIHKPSFTNALSLNQVPLHLLYAMCAMAARHSKQPSLSGGRFSGQPFADEAIRLMFDDGIGEGTLIVPPTYQTAQALCILVIHEILGTKQKPRGKKETPHHYFPSLPVPGAHTSELPSFSRQERFRTLTLQLLQRLSVHAPEHPLLTPVPSPHYIELNIERECIRRVFWVMYVVDCMRGMYYKWEGNMLGGSGRGYSGLSSPSLVYPTIHSQPQPAVSLSGASGSAVASTSRQPLSNPYPVPLPSPVLPPGSSDWNMSLLMANGGIMGFSESDLRLRLPADETSFEMGVVHEMLPEYLHLAPTRAQSPSELAHMIRVLTIYSKVEWTLDYVADPLPHIRADARYMLSECEKLLHAWAESLPQELRFTDQNLNVQRSMLETSSNTGAWCFALTHALHASCVLALGVYNRFLEVESGKDNGPGSDVAMAEVKDVQWASEVFDSILDMLGERARNSILLGAVVWPIIRYTQREDKKVEQLLRDFEDFTGVRLDQVAGAKWTPGSPKLTEKISWQPDHKVESAASNADPAPIPRSTPGPASISNMLVNGHQGSASPKPSNMDPIGESICPNGVTSFRRSSTNIDAHRSEASNNFLPSLKSSGLLDWSNDSKSSSWNPPSVLNIPSVSGQPVYPLNDVPASNAVPTQARPQSSQAQATAQQPSSTADAPQAGGRVGLSWMMNG
ncbi:hypothetical protein D9758_003786 [Tetrapyrgos nigripes]|uniref:Zn(2)-C6 fungal-type domain-containing protein n=1 Tax=Tetrapyrgos nigripes TaxID=182062 RepID=A0A8H5GMG9_9AGAR|nr:hypothetical protein D9758_003786 [Tetrapyrgos nigripes]